MIGVATAHRPGGRVDTDLDTLATALYVTIDDTLKAAPELAPWRPAVGITPKLTDAELLTVAVMQALLGDVSEARWLRAARTRLRPMFPYLPRQSGYCKRLKAAVPQLKYFIRALARDTDLWHDPAWIADSTPIECGRSRQTVKRSALAGWADHPRRDREGLAAHPRPDRRHLAQPHHWPARHPLPDRLRPLTPSDLLI